MTAATLREDFVGLVRSKRRLLSATEHQMHGHAQETEAIDQLYESTFLEVVTRFEVFLEDLFYEVALGSSSLFRAGAVGAVAGVGSREELEAALATAGGQNYLAWLPIERTMDRANVVLRDGRPFARLERRSSEKSLLKEVAVVRNAVAHRSGDAQARFLNLCPTHLTASRRTPAGLLRSTVGLTTKYEALCNGLGQIVRALAARSDSQAWGLLSPELERTAGKVAPAGTYVCSACGLTATHTAGVLQACVCHTGPCLACGVEQPSKLKRTAPA